MKRISTVVLTFVVIVISFDLSVAGLVTFEREFRYQATAMDNLISCRMIALEQAKRLLLEELGIYLESYTEVKNFSLTRDKITVLTAGIVRTTIIDEKWDNKTYYLKAQMMTDPDDVTRKIDVLRRDRLRSEELGAARKLYDSGHLALRAGKVNESESLLKQVVDRYPSTDYAAAAKEQLDKFVQIRQFDIQRYDSLAQASVERFRTLLEAYFVDWLTVPSSLNDLKKLVGNPEYVLGVGVKIFYIRQNKTPQEFQYALFAFHEFGQKVYFLNSDDVRISEIEKKSEVLAALKSDYQMIEASEHITILESKGADH